MKKLLLFSLLLISTHAMALTSFDKDKKTLTFDSYANEGQVYQNVVVEITSAKVVSVGTHTATKDTPCSETFTTLQYNQIKLGQTTKQVMDILGCGYDPRISERAVDGKTALAGFESTGNILQMVKVNFSTTTGKVVVGGDGKTFKGKSGF